MPSESGASGFPEAEAIFFATGANKAFLTLGEKGFSKGKKQRNVT